MQGTLQKKYKIYKSIEKLAHIIFINFKHVKISQNSQRKYQEHIAIFLEFFVGKLECTGVQVARTGVSIAKKFKKNKRN